MEIIKLLILIGYWTFNSEYLCFTAKTESSAQYAVVVGLDDGPTISKYVVKINLHQPNEITTQKEIPTTMVDEAFAAVYKNTMYVAGLETSADEIWTKHLVGCNVHL